MVLRHDTLITQLRIASNSARQSLNVSEVVHPDRRGRGPQTRAGGRSTGACEVFAVSSQDVGNPLSSGSTEVMFQPRWLRPRSFLGSGLGNVNDMAQHLSEATSSPAPIAARTAATSPTPALSSTFRPVRAVVVRTSGKPSPAATAWTTHTRIAAKGYRWRYSPRKKAR
jgi:hypothetical protein